MLAAFNAANKLALVRQALARQTMDAPSVAGSPLSQRVERIDRRRT